MAWLLIVPMAALLGASVAAYRPAALLILAVAAAAVVLGFAGASRRLFLWAITALLLGYQFGGRGFAYLGVAPAFVGEMTLAVGLFALAVARPIRRLGTLQWVLIAFMAWGAIRTLPYFETYGLDAARDAIVWIYAAFALVLSLLLRAPDIRRAVEIYATALSIFVVWVPVLAVIWVAAPQILPLAPGTFVQVPFFKAGDMGVHLSGAAAFLLVGLSIRRDWRAFQGLLWLPWLVGFGIVASLSRAAMLAVAIVPVILPFRRRLGRWGTPVLISLMLIGVVGAANVEFDVGRRSISTEQVISNFGSVIGIGGDQELAGTREWRERWWRTILDYTLDGPYFWTGKGYGISLAEDDGFLGDDPNLRAPHNGHLNILARSGVPGLTLWLLLAAGFAVAMIRAARAAAQARMTMWVALLGWLSAYWLAAFVNMSFDVYLEGPQGGILFWSLTGIGLAAAACVHEAIAADHSLGQPAPAATPITADALHEARFEPDDREAIAIRLSGQSSDDA
jgi:O-antigen ligase